MSYHQVLRIYEHKNPRALPTRFVIAVRESLYVNMTKTPERFIQVTCAYMSAFTVLETCRCEEWGSKVADALRIAIRDTGEKKSSIMRGC
jgi:hypothetical protein